MGRVGRLLVWGLSGLVAVLLVVGMAGWFLLDRIDLGGFAGRRATAALGRGVAFGSLHVTPGRWLRVVVADARVDNAPGGSRPEMVRVAQGTAEVEAWPLLHGAFVVRNAAVDGLDVLLEHGPDGVPNWRLKPGASKKSGPPSREGSFPTLLAAKVTGKIMVRTSSGAELPIGLDGITFSTPAVDQPSRLVGAGSYKGVPVQLDSRLGSITQYRKAAEPFPAVIDMVSGDTHLHFDGTMADPLGLDGARGQLSIEAATPAVLYRVSGLEASFEQPVKLQGGMLHDDNVWELSQVQGGLGSAAIYGGTLRLEEGQRPNDSAPRAPDRVGVALRFEELDLDAVIGGKKGKSDGADVSLQVDRQPSTLIAAKLLARGVTYGGVKFANVELDASQTAGQVAVEGLSMSYLGGRVEAQGKIDAVAEGGRVSAEVRVVGMDVSALRGLLDMGRLPVTGRMDGRVVVAATGETLNQAVRSSRASAVVTMAGGAVSKEVVQLGSTDLRALFGKAEGMVRVSCVLGVLDVRSGIGTISPIRLRSAEGTIAAHGTVDLVRHRVDLTVESESRTTSIFALDVPVRAYGPFADISFVPAQLSAAGRAQAASGDEIGRLLPALQETARASPCLGR